MAFLNVSTINSRGEVFVVMLPDVKPAPADEGAHTGASTYILYCRGATALDLLNSSQHVIMQFFATFFFSK